MSPTTPSTDFASVVRRKQYDYVVAHAFQPQRAIAALPGPPEMQRESSSIPKTTETSSVSGNTTPVAYSIKVPRLRPAVLFGSDQS